MYKNQQFDTQEKIIVRKSSPLQGRVRVNGAKNAVLPIMAASLLGENGLSIIEDVPNLEDVRTLINALQQLGAKVDFNNEKLIVNANNLTSYVPPRALVQQMRASFLLMGALLARSGNVKMYLPGGCAIGTRPIDQHLKGFQALGAKIEQTSEYVQAIVDEKLRGATVYLDVPSVGATENIMMAATLAEGTTIIENCAQEPEIVDLANYLNAMGARVRGAGTTIIRIDGVQSLQGASHTVIPDRIEAGTYMTMAAATGGDVFVENAMCDHLRAVIAKLIESGVTITEHEEGIRVQARQPLQALNIKTLPYPGFPTDLQAQFTGMLALAGGCSEITETVFENRYMHCSQLQKMGAEIVVEGRQAKIIGKSKLKGACVEMTDLRAGAALILAGMVAEGTTEITGLHHIDRGYVDIVGKLTGLGADIQRITPRAIYDNAKSKSQVEEKTELVRKRLQPSYA